MMKRQGGGQWLAALFVAQQTVDSGSTLYVDLIVRPAINLKAAERLAASGIKPSVVSVGDSYDNALAETINSLYKAEVIHRRGP